MVAKDHEKLRSSVNTQIETERHMEKKINIKQ
jgi:hypothetical protein